MNPRIKIRRRIVKKRITTSRNHGRIDQETRIGGKSSTTRTEVTKADAAWRSSRRLASKLTGAEEVIFLGIAKARRMSGDKRGARMHFSK
jgi:hypothetical protein